MESSLRARAGFEFTDFAVFFVLVFLRLVEGAALLSSRLRFRWDAGAVKKEDIRKEDASPKQKLGHLAIMLESNIRSLHRVFQTF